MARNDEGVYEHKGKCRLIWRTEGKRKSKLLDIPWTKVGRQKAARIREQILRDEYLGKEEEESAAPCPTFHEVAQIKIDSLAAGSANHQRNVTSDLNKYWMPHFANTRVNQITHLQIVDKVVNLVLKLNLAAKTRRGIISAGSGVFKLAVTSGYMQANPAANITFDNQVGDPDPFTDEEMEALLDELKPGFRFFYLIRWYAGLRPGETIALRWSDYDQINQKLHITKSRSRGIEGPTKTRKVRSVHVHPRLAKALQKAPKHITCTSILFTSRGQPFLGGQKMAQAFSQAQRDLGLRWRHPYNVRHSCASRWLKAGIKPAFAAQQLGHSLEMFFRIYAKWIDVDETKRQEKMMDAI